MYQLNFEQFTIYDAGRRGITVDVQIRLLNSAVDFQTKIDTGSEACIFARNFGEKLGLEIETGEEQYFSTVTGSFKTFGHSVNLIVANLEFDSLVFFADDYNFSRNVLGRHGFLDRVIIGINDYDGKLYLNRYENE